MATPLPRSQSQSAPLAVTIGEPAGIGPDIVLQAANADKNLPPFVVLGDAAFLRQRAKLLGADIRVQEWRPGEKLVADTLNVRSLAAAPLVSRPGTPQATDAPAVIEAIARGVEMVFAGEAAGLVTAPISKAALYDIGFSHPGHTEFLAELAERHTGKASRPVMMIASPLLRTVPVTIHEPLAKVAGLLNEKLIMETCQIVDADLRRRFGISVPRLAVSGLNPHAGENGAMGSEDASIIAPAIARLQSLGVNAFGPLPADTMFHPAARQRYDVAICMYHDQALIPAKTLAFDDGVNVTLGLPFIRTSPDHGTAFDIAGTGKAKPDSFIAALRMAWEMVAAESSAEMRS